MDQAILTFVSVLNKNGNVLPDWDRKTKLKATKWLYSQGPLVIIFRITFINVVYKRLRNGYWKLQEFQYSNMLTFFLNYSKQPHATRIPKDEASHQHKHLSASAETIQSNISLISTSLKRIKQFKKMHLKSVFSKYWPLCVFKKELLRKSPNLVGHLQRWKHWGLHTDRN